MDVEANILAEAFSRKTVHDAAGFADDSPLEDSVVNLGLTQVAAVETLVKGQSSLAADSPTAVSYTHLRAHET